MIKYRVCMSLLSASLAGACAAGGCRSAGEHHSGGHSTAVVSVPTPAPASVVVEEPGEGSEYEPNPFRRDSVPPLVESEAPPTTDIDAPEEAPAEQTNPFLVLQDEPAAEVVEVPEAESTAEQAPKTLTPLEELVRLGAMIERGEDGEPVAMELSHLPVRDGDLTGLAELHTLKQLDLNETLITDDGLPHVSELAELQLLGLRGTAITDAGLVHLAALHKLRYLLLCRTNIGDAGLVHLQGLTTLEGLSLIDCRVSEAGVAELQRHLPECRIILAVPAGGDPELLEPQNGRGDDDRPAPFEPATPFGLPESTERLEDSELPLRDEPNPFLELPPAPAPAGGGPEFERETGVPPARGIENSERSPRTPRSERQESVPRSKGGGPTFLPKAKTLPASAVMPIDDGEPLAAVRAVLRDPAVLRDVSRMYAARERWPEAAVTLQRAYALNPDDVRLEYDLGVALARAGRIHEALPHLASSVGEPAAYYNIGLLAFEQGRLDESRRSLRRALALQPDFPEARFWLSQIDATTVAQVVPAELPADEDDRMLELIEHLLESETDSEVR